MDGLEEKIKGALFGIAVGDALGAPVEFMNPWMIKLRYGRITSYKSGILGIPLLFRFKGTVTDDTSLSIRVLRGILANPETPYETIGKEFVSYRNSLPLFIGKNLLYCFLLYKGDWCDL